MSDHKPPFHLAFPVTDLEASRAFYVDLLGCTSGRESERWIDFNFFGHQITAHLADEVQTGAHNPVDGDQVPVRHFGAILEMSAWQALADKLKNQGIKFLIEPHIRFAGQIGEQATMFFHDPCGNAIEFKSFADSDYIFAR